MLPRHAANSMELKEGTGGITAMVPCGKFMEMYKIDKTFRVQSPECIDPEETNPNAPWVASPTDDVGSQNPIVAVFIQSYEMLKSGFTSDIFSTEEMTILLRDCKEALISCEKESKNISANIDKITNQIDQSGIEQEKNGRGLNPFPQVHDLEKNCGSFLVFANRAIRKICEIPYYVLSLERIDSNFDHLSKRITKMFGEDANFSKFVAGNSENIKYIVDLRNFHEHPKERKTIIENFKILPNSSVQVPMWGFEGNDLSPIKEEMKVIITILTESMEAMLIHSLLSCQSKLPLIIEEVDKKDIDKNLPIRYRLSVNLSQMIKA